MQRKTILRRVGRASPKSSRRSPSLWEITEGLPPSPLERAERARREAEAKEEAEKAAAVPGPTEAKAKPAETKPAETQPPAPQTPPPEPQWWEEKCRWRLRGEADQYDDGDGMEYCETIHRYDPLERALEEEDYDPDN